MPQPKTPEQVAADEEQASKEHREQLAREANKKRNDALLEARNAIADRADEIKTEEDDLEPLTDEKWDQEDRPDQVTRRTRAERLAAQEEEEAEDEATKGMTESEKEAYYAAKIIRDNEQLDEDLDEARDAGADDSRKNADGEVEYRIEVAGKVKWLTLAQLREQAGDVPTDDESGQPGKKGVTTPATRTPSPEALEAQRQAEEQVNAQRAERRAKLKDLYTRASMGDEEAIDALADMQADDSRVTPELLTRMVDERVDARVEGKTAFDRAVEWFESDDGYGRELAAPGFKKKAAEIDARLAREQPELTPRQRLDLTGKELRTELKQLQEYLGVKPDASVGARRGARPDSKLDRKRNAPAEVPRASGRPRPDVEPDEVQTTQDAIQQLARGRGQQRPISHKH
jgi:hypothetical protein